MAGSRRIVVEFLGKDTSASATAREVEGSTSKLGARMAKVGKIAAVGLAAGTVIAGKALFDMGKNAMSDEAAQRKLALALKNTTGANKAAVAGVEDWISAQGRALGVTDDELRPAFQRLAQSTGSIAEAQRLSSLAMDASVGSGKSLKVVSEALAKAQAGNMGALSKLGIRIKDANGETMSFNEVTKDMAKTFHGQASKAANSAEGKFARLQLVLDETKETIGAKLIPVATKLADWFLNSGLPAIEKFGTWMSENLGPIFERIGDLISRVTGGMNGDVSKNLGAISSTFASVTSIWTSLWNRFGADLLAFLRSTFDNFRKLVGGALQVISGIFKVFASLLKGDWSGVWSGIKQILSGALTVIKAVLSQALNVIKSLFKVAWSAIRGIVGGAWDGIKGLIRAGADGIVNAIKAIPGRVKELGGVFKSAGKHLIDQMVEGLKNAAGVISGIAGNVWDAVKSLLNGGIDKINAALEFKISLPGPDISVNPPNIPHLAKGGIVRARSGGTLALLGEAGHDEAVVPLSGPNAPKLAGSSGTVTHVLDLRLNGRTIRKMLLEDKNLSGIELGLT